MARAGHIPTLSRHVRQPFSARRARAIARDLVAAPRAWRDADGVLWGNPLALVLPIAAAAVLYLGGLELLSLLIAGAFF